MVCRKVVCVVRDAAKYETSDPDTEQLGIYF